MFSLELHQRNYQKDYYTLVDDIIPNIDCENIMKKIEQLINENKISLVNHEGIGKQKYLDGGGKYLHHIFKGSDIQNYFPELIGLYYGLLPSINAITCSRTVLSPYPDSNINIKVYPPNGGTLGWHFDTNGITVVIYLTTNQEAPLVVNIPRSHPSKEDWIETKEIFAEKGKMLVMKGREVWHKSSPTITEIKAALIFNYYEEGDTWRPSNFDQFVYEGKDTSR